MEIKRETILYKGKKYHRYPDSERRQLRVYFWRHDKWKASPVPLHRQIWIDYNGKIPKNYIIHHKNRDTLDNSIQNLELLSPEAHSTHHIQERRIEKEGICETCRRTFKYYSVRKAKFCSYLCYSRARRKRNCRNL